MFILADFARIRQIEIEIKMKIPYSIRKLLSNKPAIDVIKAILLKEEKIGDKTKVRLPLLESSIREYHEQYFSDYSKEPLNYPDSLFDTPDCQLIEMLTKNNAITSDIGPDENLSWLALTKIKKESLIKKCYEWAKDKDIIINYGIFSLHTFTGEAYCLDNKYIFHTGKGLFRAFRSFLEEPTHILAYEKIYDTFQDSDKLDCGSEEIHQIIGEIKEKLKMKGKLSKLFMPSSNKYLLKSS